MDEFRFFPVYMYLFVYDVDTFETLKYTIDLIIPD